ncbi:MAG: SsrA-binding protein SmpB [Phycisphaeraceae bacterium]|nr:SsrA-binding protein SmpB [Phycisphaeraceae bacterium]
MARTDSNKSKKDMSPRIANRRALRDYHISEKLEVGIQLLGTEVKSIRLGQVSLAEGYALVDTRKMELYLHDVDIAHYPQAPPESQHQPKRPRKLLAHKRQIEKLFGHTTAKGVTLVPLALYFQHGLIKLEIGIGVGKKLYDKRQDIKKREADKAIKRGMTRKVI